MVQMAQMLNVEESLNNTIQTNYQNANSSPISMLMLMAKSNDIISGWWSKRRDIELRRFVKSSDHLSGAVYNMVAKMTAIPIKVEARDKSIKSHVEMAKRYTDILINASQFGEGWNAFYGKWVEDLFCQDNGAFAEIIGPGNPAGPLDGAPISIAHLDSSRCVRTGDAEFPVLYEGLNGRRYKLHYTRVMFSSQLPSTQVEMNGVGFCAVSRCINAAQNLFDISVYKQEKLGSRPPRQMMLTGGGLDPEDIQTAVRLAENSMTSSGLNKFSKTIVAGSRNFLDPKLQVIDMASVPDGFDEKTSTVLGMAIIAMAFGMDARELFPAMEAGASKADAIGQHMKQRGKGPGQTIEITEKQLSIKALPPYLVATFDYQDDAQDRQVADIRNIRAQARQRDTLVKITDVRIERENMMSNGELSPEQFEYLELNDGRLVDGVSVDVLFHTDDKDYKGWLDGVTESNYEDKMNEMMKVVVTSRDSELIKKARRAMAAVKHKIIDPLMMQQELEQQQEMAMMGQQGRTNKLGATAGINPKKKLDSKTDDSYQQEKFGRKIGTDPATPKDSDVNQ
jgi:hypothetical protein